MGIWGKSKETKLISHRTIWGVVGACCEQIFTPKTWIYSNYSKHLLELGLDTFQTLYVRVPWRVPVLSVRA